MTAKKWIYRLSEFRSKLIFGARAGRQIRHVNRRTAQQDNDERGTRKWPTRTRGLMSSARFLR